MNMYDIINKKKNGAALDKEEIRFFIDGVTSGRIPNYQTSALLMAICLKGMNDDETFALTDAMLHSGDVLTLKEISGIKVDKHSTGGVGDKTTLVLAPMLAACNLRVAKMSGRGLGHTGGTIDKLESIPGFSTSLSEENFIKTVNKHGIAVAAQTADIAPADKILYALRDVTATVDNVSLIASSIMSKKLACGADCIVLDVKTGSGSFTDTYEKARELAEKMVNIGTNAGKKICAVISDMNQPLGNAVGNALEVREAVETLKGKGPQDLMELCIALAEALMNVSGICTDKNKAEAMLKEAITSGKAYEKFKEFAAAQGGDVKYIDDVSMLPVSAYSAEVTLDGKGYVHAINCKEIGMSALTLGAGREVKDAPIDFGAGIIIRKKIGDFVSESESIATIFSSDEAKLKIAAQRLKAAYTLDSEAPDKTPLIYGTLGKQS